MAVRPGIRPAGRRMTVVNVRRLAFAVSVAVNKTVALLDVLDRPEHVHGILDAETQATMGWLDTWFQERGGSRGRAQVRTPTFGLTYTVTRTVTSRAGDPSAQDRVLVANVIEMRDPKGGHKALDSAALRDNLEAATMVGRLSSAARAIALGYTIEPDVGPTGRRRSWRIVGIPYRACVLLSQRRNQIVGHVDGNGSARRAVVPATGGLHRWVGAATMRPLWQAELAAIGLPHTVLQARLGHPSNGGPNRPRMLTNDRLNWIVADVLGDGGPLDHHAEFTRSRLIAELAPRLYCFEPDALDRAVERILDSHQVVELEPVDRAREPVFVLTRRFRRAPARAR